MPPARKLAPAAGKSASKTQPARRASHGAEPRIWVIVPTYNERENLAPISEAILATLPAANILIVDDASPDGTGQLADELAARNPRIAVLHRQAKQGLGRAYVAAFHDVLDRGADLVVHMDADFSHPVRYLPSLLEPIQVGGADLVLGSRYVKGGKIPRWNILRRVVSRCGSLFAGVVLLMPYRDLTGGFKVFRSEVLRAISIDRLHAGGYAFQIETTFLSRLAGARILEVPITFEERRAGQSKMSMAIFMEAFRLVLILRIKNLRRRRKALPSAS